MERHFDIDIDDQAREALRGIAHVLAARSAAGYLSGGSVRDALLGRARGDIDIAVAGDAMELGRDIARELGGRYVPLDPANGVARVVLFRERPLHVDLTSLRGDIWADLGLRDFTVNAMAVALSDIGAPVGGLIDPFGGRRDLEAGVVRAVSEEAFPRDGLRLFRAVRLVAELGFALDGETREMVVRHHRLIASVAAERVNDELCRILAAPGAVPALRLLDEVGLLIDIIPELSAARGAEQPREHWWDVLEHSVETVAAVAFLLGAAGSPHWGEEVRAQVTWPGVPDGYFQREVAAGHARSTVVKLAALLHDVAKPQTRCTDERGRMRFYGHAKEGALIADVVMERLRFSARERGLVVTMVGHHLHPRQMGDIPSRRAIYRYFRDVGDAAIDTLLLNLADHLATRGPALDLEEWQRHVDSVAYILEQHLGGEDVVVPAKLISGHDIIERFGLSPGPQVGQLLEAVREAWAAGEVSSREEALALVQSMLRGNPVPLPQAASAE